MENCDTAGQSLNRKLEGELMKQAQTYPEQPRSLASDILQQVSLLNSALRPPSISDRVTFEKAIHFLSSLTTNKDYANTMVSCGAIPALVRHLQVPDDAVKDDEITEESYEHEVKEWCASILGLLARQEEHRQPIIDAGALPCLIDLLRSHKPLCGLLRRVAYAIANLCDDKTIKTLVRMEEGIPLLVELLEFDDIMVQIASARALRKLSSKNPVNKKKIVQSNALPTLVLMLHSWDPTIQYEAVHVIGNLVNSSEYVQTDILLAGALQPIIRLLSSSSWGSQRVAAFLLGNFAATDLACQVHIGQRGAIPPLVDMLKSPHLKLREMSAFALGRLATKNPHNQAGIAQNGGVEPLLNILLDPNDQNDDQNDMLRRHEAIYALFSLAGNKDIVAEIIKAGGFQRLKAGHFQFLPTRQQVAKTLEKLEENSGGQVMKHLIYLMRVGEEGVQRRVAIALAYLCPPCDCKTIFIDNDGLKLLLDALKSENISQKHDASAALRKLASIISSTTSLFDIAPPSPTSHMYLDEEEEYVNNPKLSDVTFLVEGKTFYAHRDCLLSSDIFRSMFDASDMEREAKDIVIPYIKWNIFELMIRFMYSGTLDVNCDIAQDLLRAADEYLLHDLKRVCEHAIAQNICGENVLRLYKMSEDFKATTLKHACILFMLEKFDNLSPQLSYLSRLDAFYRTYLCCSQL